MRHTFGFVQEGTKLAANFIEYHNKPAPNTQRSCPIRLRDLHKSLRDLDKLRTRCVFRSILFWLPLICIYQDVIESIVVAALMAFLGIGHNFPQPRVEIVVLSDLESPSLGLWKSKLPPCVPLMYHPQHVNGGGGGDDSSTIQPSLL